MTGERFEAFTTNAPASTANIGVGFDCLGLAVELRNSLHVSPGIGEVIVEGEGRKVLPHDSTNLVVRCIEDIVPGASNYIDVRCVNRIPPARGLGSSTAAAATGFIAGWMIAGHDWTARDLFLQLAELDGHADNAAPCAYGGATIAPAAVIEAGLPPLEFNEPEWLTALFVVPDHEVSTGKARQALPDSYSREETVAALTNAAGLVGALVSGNEEALRVLLAADIVHEPARAALVPELAVVRALVAGTPALGATISGAGPTVAVWCRDEHRAALLEHLDDAIEVKLPGARVLKLELTPAGSGASANR